MQDSGGFCLPGSAAAVSAAAAKEKVEARGPPLPVPWFLRSLSSRTGPCEFNEFPVDGGESVIFGISGRRKGLAGVSSSGSDDRP